MRLENEQYEEIKQTFNTHLKKEGDTHGVRGHPKMNTN